MAHTEKLGRIDIKKSSEHPSIKLWGIVGAEEIIAKLEEVKANPKEKDAILKGWEKIVTFTEIGGTMTSSGLLVPEGSDVTISVPRGTKVFELRQDFAPSLGYIPTTGGTANLYSSIYQNVLGIRKGMGKFMHTTYRNQGVLEGYTVDPDAIAQQVLLHLAITRGQGRINPAL